MNVNDWWIYLIFALACYLLCNFNFAIFFTKKIKKEDIRSKGSGNPGTTNVFRVYGYKMGLLIFVFDMGKGLVCALAGYLIFGALYGNELDARFFAYVGGLCAGLGHVFPVVYNFRGGKGFATGIGVFLVADPVFAAIGLVIGVVVLLITDRMSVFALFFFVALCIESAITMLPEKWMLFIPVVLYCAMVVYAHRSNIKRLIKGNENPSGIRKMFRK